MTYGATLWALGSETRLVLHHGARQRLREAFRQKMQQCYKMLFRTFGFCVCLSLDLNKVSTDDALFYLEYLVRNDVSVNMIANHVSVVRANFVILGLDFLIWDHPNIKYFQKSIKINRPLVATTTNLTDIQALTAMVKHCDSLYLSPIFKDVFLVGFFGFLCLLNISPHSKFHKIISKWSKRPGTGCMSYHFLG